MKSPSKKNLSAVARRILGVGVGEGVEEGEGILDGVTSGGKDELEFTGAIVWWVAELSGLVLAQLTSKIEMHNPKRTNLVFMEMLITRDGRGVNVVHFRERTTFCPIVK
jgi:hypothetical protein